MDGPSPEPPPDFARHTHDARAHESVPKPHRHESGVYQARGDREEGGKSLLYIQRQPNVSQQLEHLA